MSAGLSVWLDHGYWRSVLATDKVFEGVVGVGAPAGGMGTDVRGVVYALGFCQLRRVDGPGVSRAV